MLSKTLHPGITIQNILDSERSLVSTPNTRVEVVLAGVPTKYWVLHGIQTSYSDVPNGGGVVVLSPSLGNLLNLDIVESGISRDILSGTIIVGVIGEDLTVRLKAGGAGS